MYDIKHLFHIAQPRHQVFEMLSTIDGLSGWWTNDTSGDSALGGTIDFKFGQMGAFKMKVVALEADQVVTWECLAGPPNWVGHKISFQLDDNDGKTRVRFSHGSWAAQDDGMAISAFSWGRYLESLRQLCQTGKGTPFEVAAAAGN
jgi:uncharacterized protein YndB with AHSA1/START domain